MVYGHIKSLTYGQVGTARELMPLIAFPRWGPAEPSTQQVEPWKYRQGWCRPLEVQLTHQQDYSQQNGPQMPSFGELGGGKRMIENHLLPRDILDILTPQTGFQKKEPKKHGKRTTSRVMLRKISS